MTETARGILAITPEEGAGVQALAERLTAEFDAWAVLHVQRAEPEGNVLAKYSLSLDPEFSRNLSNNFSAGVIAALGAERGEMLLGYARSWTADLGMFGGTSVMTLERPGTEDERIRLELKMPDGGTMSTDFRPINPSPRRSARFFPAVGWTWPGEKVSNCRRSSKRKTAKSYRASNAEPQSPALGMGASGIPPMTSPSERGVYAASSLKSSQVIVSPCPSDAAAA